MMDTRSKIVTLEEAQQLCENCPIVTAYCDPLLPEEVERLRALGRDVIVIIVDPPQPLLEPRARAELAAALSFVRAVAIGGPGFARPAEEHAARERFLEMVRRRAGG